jgi:molybdopterin/thiamine biosynthesis adenylyltransferase
MTAFSYSEFITRNIGFVTAAEQERLRTARVFVCGAGGMGGACLQALVRAGVGAFGVADMDVFELSNLNRQVFADLETVGREKVAATVERLRRINPEATIETFGADWVGRLDELLPRYPVVVNGMDDVRAGIALYRKARAHRATVVDAYTSPLPSVTVVGPDDPRPEERLGFPTLGRPPEALSEEDRAACTAREIEYVLVNSSSARHVDIGVAAELLAGKRKRMSFAPMVITTGNLMAFEVVKLALGRRPVADCRGYFFNPWAMRIERPRAAPVAWALRFAVRRFLAKLTDA